MSKQIFRINDYVSFRTKKFGKDTIGIAENFVGKKLVRITVRNGTFKPHQYVRPVWMLGKDRKLLDTLVKTEVPGEGVPSHIEFWCGNCEVGLCMMGEMADGFTKFVKSKKVIPVCRICGGLFVTTIRLYGSMEVTC
jgi:hypothetical protein